MYKRINGTAIRERGGVREWKETPADNEEWSCVFRGPGDCRRVFVVLKAAPREFRSGRGSCWKRTVPGEGALREPFGGVRVGGS